MGLTLTSVTTRQGSATVNLVYMAGSVINVLPDTTIFPFVGVSTELKSVHLLHEYIAINDVFEVVSDIDFYHNHVQKNLT